MFDGAIRPLADGARTIRVRANRAVSACGTCHAHRKTVVRVLSASDFVEALLKLGFRVVEVREECTVLESIDAGVVVPAIEDLGDDVQEILLVTAGVRREDVLGVLRMDTAHGTKPKA